MNRNAVAVAVLWLAVAVQATWVLLNSLTLHRSPGLDVAGVIILVAFTAFAALHARPRWRWLAFLIRALMASDFLLAVADRFGVLGPPGTPGVVSGDFAHFIDYTRSVASFAPESFGPILAVLATIAELTFATVLLLGIRLPLAAFGAALLLATYATSMTISLPPAEQFHYNVFVLSAGMLTLATLNRSPLTKDGALSHLRRPWLRTPPKPTPPTASHLEQVSRQHRDGEAW